MLPVLAVSLLLASLFDPILWTLALCGVLLGRKLVWPTWATVLVATALCVSGSLLIWNIINPRDLDFLRFGVRVTAGLVAAGLVLLILRAFGKRDA